MALAVTFCEGELLTRSKPVLLARRDGPPGQVGTVVDLSEG